MANEKDYQNTISRNLLFETFFIKYTKITHIKMIVEVSHISKKIGKSILLDDISLSLKKGEVFGFLGHNGAGKTTTMKSILGVVKVDSGFVNILGGNIEDPKIRKRIGFMPENTYLYKHLTGDEFLDWSGSFY